MTNSDFALGSRSHTVSSLSLKALAYLFSSEIVVTHVIRFTAFRSTSWFLLLPISFSIHFRLSIAIDRLFFVLCEVTRTSHPSNKPSCTPSMFKSDLVWRSDLCTDPAPVGIGSLRGSYHIRVLLMRWWTVSLRWSWRSCIDEFCLSNNNNIRWRFNRRPSYPIFRHDWDFPRLKFCRRAGILHLHTIIVISSILVITTPIS